QLVLIFLDSLRKHGIEQGDLMPCLAQDLRYLQRSQRGIWLATRDLLGIEPEEVGVANQNRKHCPRGAPVRLERHRQGCPDPMSLPVELSTGPASTGTDTRHESRLVGKCSEASSGFKRRARGGQGLDISSVPREPSPGSPTAHRPAWSRHWRCRQKRRLF